MCHWMLRNLWKVLCAPVPSGVFTFWGQKSYFSLIDDDNNNNNKKCSLRSFFFAGIILAVVHFPACHWARHDDYNEEWNPDLWTPEDVFHSRPGSRRFLSHWQGRPIEYEMWNQSSVVLWDVHMHAQIKHQLVGKVCLFFAFHTSSNSSSLVHCSDCDRYFCRGRVSWL